MMSLFEPVGRLWQDSHSAWKRALPWVARAAGAPGSSGGWMLSSSRRPACWNGLGECWSEKRNARNFSNWASESGCAAPCRYTKAALNSDRLRLCSPRHWKGADRSMPARDWVRSGPLSSSSDDRFHTTRSVRPSTWHEAQELLLSAELDAS